MPGDEGVLTATNEDLVRSVFISQLGSVALSRLLFVGRQRLVQTSTWGEAGRKAHKFDGNLLVVQQIGSLENDTE